ncbi:hypothetical protein P8452_50939 [Trifolium repens]|nr:hypothetical protein P8452_50939 [Trifolium repens]
MTPPPETFLCEDLMIEILSRLPVKSLLRFRCISKSLNSLISNPIFVKLHLQRSQKNINLLLRFTYYLRTFSLVNKYSLSTIVEDFDFGSDFKKFKVVGSCNGLVCLVAEYSFNRSSTRYLVCLWNPSTNSKSYKACSVHSKNTFRSFPMFGFGYDSLSDSYKVIIVHFKNYKNYVSIKSKVNVYDKRHNCWRNIQNFPGFNIHMENPGIYLNGTINWLAISDLDHYWDFPLYIVSLNLGNEKYTQLSLPSCFDQVVRVGRTKPCLGILKDRLCFSYDDVAKTHFVLWQMNEYGVENSWTQLLKFSYQAPQIDCTTQEYCILPPLGTLKNDHLILIESVDDRLQATILSKKEGNAKIPMNMLWLYTRGYVPSLISPSQN